MPQAANGRVQYSRFYKGRTVRKEGMTDKQWADYLKEMEMVTESLTPGKVKGRCKWFNSQKGYGFVVPEAKGSKDVFVHHTAIQAEGYKTLHEGDIVEFTLITSEKGLQANDVVIISSDFK